jgi:hypothetical protein
LEHILAARKARLGDYPGHGESRDEPCYPQLQMSRNLSPCAKAMGVVPGCTGVEHPLTWWRSGTKVGFDIRKHVRVARTWTRTMCGKDRLRIATVNTPSGQREESCVEKMKDYGEDLGRLLQLLKLWLSIGKTIRRKHHFIADIPLRPSSTPCDAKSTTFGQIHEPLDMGCEAVMSSLARREVPSQPGGVGTKSSN